MRALGDARPVASKKSSGDVTNLTLEVLKDIRQELRGVRAEVAETNVRMGKLAERVDKLAERVDRLADETREGFERLERKLESGALADQHIRERLVALEEWAEGQGYHPG